MLLITRSRSSGWMRPYHQSTVDPISSPLYLRSTWLEPVQLQRPERTCHSRIALCVARATSR